MPGKPSAARKFQLLSSPIKSKREAMYTTVVYRGHDIRVYKEYKNFSIHSYQGSHGLRLTLEEAKEFIDRMIPEYERVRVKVRRE